MINDQRATAVIFNTRADAQLARRLLIESGVYAMVSGMTVNSDCSLLHMQVIIHMMSTIKNLSVQEITNFEDAEIDLSLLFPKRSAFWKTIDSMGHDTVLALLQDGFYPDEVRDQVVTVARSQQDSYSLT